MKGQSAELERLQKIAAKLAFGFHFHYQDILEQHDLKSLAEQRIAATKRFVAKTLASRDTRFSSKWFIPRRAIETDLRRRRPFTETKARTEKYRRSPLLHLQRIANDLSS